MRKEFSKIDGTKSVKLPCNSYLKRAFYSSRELCFQTADGISARIVCEGKRGWRLQASLQDDLTFSFSGAAQSLAKFMGESDSDCDEALTVAESADAIRMCAPDGTSAFLSLKDNFSLTFISVNGAVKSEICDMRASGGRFVMQGVLQDGEAVFGGGARFDSADKRGTKIELYSCDGWNNTATTYVPIPLFFTSRGGGIFINLYDTAFADFGKECFDRWSYTVMREVMDCYFYPSEDPANVLLGYTELSGHAYMPSPWMQGVHICRYGPDFQTFDRDFKETSIEAFDGWEQLYIPRNDGYVLIKEASAQECALADRFYLLVDDGTFKLAYVKDDAGAYYKRGPKNSPGGNSVKTIMQRFMQADMKPNAASMENFAWWKAFADRKPEIYDRPHLVRTVDWLHEHGVRSMVYVACGRAGILENSGFREEYLVHADVEFKNADGSVTRYENTTAIPWVLGTGENPDVWRSGDGRYRAEKYLDITNDEALEWYFDHIWGEMIDIGVDGVKIDFCEEMPDHGKLCGNSVTYYHWKDPSRIVAGTEHHAYPTYFISAFYKRMVEHQARRGLDDGFMVFSRGGGIGSQRSPYMWAGDQARKFEKLKDQLLAVVNAGLSGLPFMSYDMAGYQYWGESYHTIGKARESEIFARAVEFTALTTNMQTHGDVRHAYEMTEEVQKIYRLFTHLHTELIPYVQKYSAIACKTGMPPVRHLALKDLMDRNVYGINDEFMLGDALLVAPILTENTFEREVYLPAGVWTNLLTGEETAGGKTVKVRASLGQLPVFLDQTSADATELMPIFSGSTWNEIKHFA